MKKAPHKIWILNKLHKLNMFRNRDMEHHAHASSTYLGYKPYGNGNYITYCGNHTIVTRGMI